MQREERVKNTKQKLFKGFADLMKVKKFGDITVTNICEMADVSRITFYTYYTDKYDFVDDLLKDIYVVVAQDFQERQQKNNRRDDPRKACHNLLNSVIDIQMENDFYKTVLGDDCHYIVFSFYWYIVRAAGQKAQDYFERLGLNYPEGMASAFAISGIAAYMRQAFAQNRRVAVIHREANRLLDNIIDSRILTRQVSEPLMANAEKVPAGEDNQGIDD